MGFGVRYEKGEGPLIEDPLRKPSDIDRLRPCPRGSLGFVMEAARMVRARLRPEIPLIGFAGAPFTLASYMIEGGKARSFDRTRALMRRDPGAWDLLMEKISAAVTGLLKDQVSAGAGALQIFDSWAGCLTRAEYRRYVLPHMKRLIGRLPSGTPVIHFGTGTAPFLKDFSAAGGQVIGVDHRIGLAKARKIIGPRFAVQGNLDPAVLLRTPAAIRLHVRRILDEAGERPGHIFNLGHGVLPGTPESHVRLAMEFVREESARRKSKSFPA
jgi:uroporphyrinogen decarboxylase